MIQDSESNDAQPSKISFDESFKPDFKLSNDPIELIKTNTKENSNDNNNNADKDSSNVSEDIKIPKKIMKEENSIVEENKNEMKGNGMDLENDKVKEIEKENYNKMVQEFNENVKKSNLWKKNKCLLTTLKYIFLIIIITIFIILLIIYISS